MKVRHKQTGEVLDLAQLWRMMLSDAYEEVTEKPADHWQDVTGECEYFTQREFQDCLILHHGNLIQKDGYRLRKVQAVILDPGVVLDCSTPVQLHTQLLQKMQPMFIVERKL